jgi:adenine deaminase
VDEAPSTVSGNLIDVVAGEVYPATITIDDGRIAHVERESRHYDSFLVPGLVDAHVHVESSMLVPSEFARVAVTHGTTATVSDPHEIANVLGIDGVDYMIDNGRCTPFRFHFGAPACVPATDFETAGGRLDPEQVEALLARPEVLYLSEMMNVPGVIRGDPAVHAKLAAARRHGKPVDGHAPGLRGAALAAYVAAGIQTCHETLTLDEGREKARFGMKLLVREGSAARNLDELLPLIEEFPDRCMLCSDDLHPHDLVRGHIDDMLRRGVAAGLDPLVLLRCATLNPARHYGLGIGLLQTGDAADFLRIDGLDGFHVLETRIGGRPVARDGRTLLPRRPGAAVNRFHARRLSTEDLAVPDRSRPIEVIGVREGQLVTERLTLEPSARDGRLVADPARDLLKLVVFNRYQPDAAPAVGFIQGFGLKQGALASSVAHDSHNIVAAGASDEDLVRAINRIVDHRGGLAAVAGPLDETLPLPVAGIMSDDDGWRVAERYAALDRIARELGSPLAAPFMTLSFMALLVIPALKLSDRGLFDGERFAFTGLHREP